MQTAEDENLSEDDLTAEQTAPIINDILSRKLLYTSLEATPVAEQYECMEPGINVHLIIYDRNCSVDDHGLSPSLT